jgi:hypothetical protein
MKNEKNQYQESVYAIEAAKTVFKRFRWDPTNQSAIHPLNMTTKTTVTESFVIKINDYLTRVGLKIKRINDWNNDFNLVILSELKSLED